MRSWLPWHILRVSDQIRIYFQRWLKKNKDGDSCNAKLQNNNPQTLLSLLSGCKLLFRHDLTKNWGKHCHSCVYCHSVSKKLVTAQYGGSTEEFCSEECRSKYTMLFCHVSKQPRCGYQYNQSDALPRLSVSLFSVFLRLQSVTPAAVKGN